MTLSFGLEATSAPEALRINVKRFQDDDLNEDLARDCAVKAWHLCDHVCIALGANSPFADLGELKEHVKGACAELGQLQAIWNATKHGKITRCTPRIVAARFHGGDYNSDFRRDFDISCLEIELCGGQTVMFLDVIDRAMDFWSDFFEEHGLA